MLKPRHPLRNLQRTLYLQAMDPAAREDGWRYRTVGIDDDGPEQVRFFLKTWPLGNETETGGSGRFDENAEENLLSGDYSWRVVGHDSSGIS